MPNAFIQSGGQFTGCLSFQAGTGSDNLVEISGGTNTCDRWRFGTSSGNTTGRMHMRIVGRNGVVKVGGGSFHTPYNKEDFTEPPILMEFVVDPSTRRDSAYPVTPVYVTKWGGGNGGYVLVRGVHHIRPAGGAQLVHQDYFPMYVKGHDGWISGHSGENMEAPDTERGIGRYRGGTDDQYQTVGEEMWTNQFVTVYNSSEFFDTPSNAWQFRQKLKAEAEIASGATALETPVVRGWMALPSLTARNLERMETARVRLAVTPGEGETLQSIVDGFKANGYPDSAVESDGIYNVSLVIPAGRLAAGVSTDKILFDFAVYPNYAAAKSKTPTVRATLSAAKWDPEIKQSGLIMFVR